MKRNEEKCKWRQYYHITASIENGSTCMYHFPPHPPPNEADISVVQQCRVRSWHNPWKGFKQVAFVGIQTQTSVSNLDKLVCPGDLSHQSKLTPRTPRSNKPTMFMNFHSIIPRAWSNIKLQVARTSKSWQLTEKCKGKTEWQQIYFFL